MVGEQPVGPVVEANFTLTFDEFKSAARYLRSQARGDFSWSAAAFLIFFVAFGVYTLYENGVSWIAWDGWLCSSCFVLFVLWYLSYPWRAALADKKSWRNLEELRGPQRQSFSPATASFHWTTVSVTLDWKHIKRVKRVGSNFIFNTAEKGIYITPVRAFATQEELRTFQQLVMAKVPTSQL